MINRRDICFTDLTPEQQAQWRAARQQHSTFAPAPTNTGTPPQSTNSSNVCIDDLTSQQQQEWRARIARM